MKVSFISAAEIARAQNGRITTAQLRDCGFSRGSVQAAVRAGRLHRVHTGVFALGHRAPSRVADWHAAVLACGPGAVLSHRSAATAYGIRDGVGPRVDVTVDPSSHRRRPGIAVHRATLLEFERGIWSDIPISSPSRTMVDLAHALSDPEEIEWALRQLQYRGLFDRAALELSNRRRPSRVLGRFLDDLTRTDSRLEVAFMHRVVGRHRLAPPLCQQKIEGFRVDFVWTAERVIVETDGRAHDEPSMRAADAIRDNLLGLAGYLVLRYRWADVHRHHARTAAQIAQALMNRACM